MEKLLAIRKYKNIDLYLLVLISLLPRIAYFYYRLNSAEGIPMAHDTVWYLEHANILLNQFSIQIDFNGIFYLGYYSLLAVLLYVCKTPEFIVLGQMIINGLCVVFVYWIAKMLFNRRTAIISGILYSFLWPVIFWSIYIITDSLFICLLLAQVFLLLKAFEANAKGYWVLFTLVSLYMIIFRPTGIITLTFILAYIIINRKSKIKFQMPWYLAVVIALLVLLGIIFALRHPSVIALKQSLLYNMLWLLSDNYSKGQIYDIQTQYDYIFNANTSNSFFNSFIISFFINNLGHIFILYIRRIISFVGVWIWKLNMGEPLLLVKYLLPSLLMFILIVLGIYSMKINNKLRQGSILFFVIGSIMFFTTFFFMDSAYRYRVPALVFFIMIIAYGIDFMISNLNVIKRVINR